MCESNRTKPNTTSFYQFFQEHDIKIPIIQRDYAQGRKSDKAKNVRESLLNKVEEVLFENSSKTLDLNFAYGIENENVFLPIDGQQRLTTLYLIHFYIFTICDEKKTDKCMQFTYATRSSALEFFKWIRESKDLADMISKRRSSMNNESLEVSIKQMAAYQAAWSHDPTVDSAIRMLSDIEEKFRDVTDLKPGYEKLISEKCPIKLTFISETSQTDNQSSGNKADMMYIRMNARGKTLDDFELLRASIDGICEKIIDDDWKENVIKKYDTDYLKELFSKLNTNCLNLKGVTECINRKSETVFKNIYNIASLVFGEAKLPFKEKTADYRSFMYELSGKEDLTAAKKTIQQYLEMLQYYLDYCTGKLQKQDYPEKDVFTKSELLKTGANNYIDDVVEVVYCYYYRKEQQRLPEFSVVEKLKYVLRNLYAQEWKELYSCLNNLCREAAKYEEVYVYFREIDAEGIKEQLEGCGLPDIFVRIKEQKIKAKIIKNNNLQDDYFKEFEESLGYSGKRKLQFILHLAGYWKEDTEGDLGLLQNYLSCMKDWIINGNREFRIRYALAAYLDKSLQDRQTIDQNAEDKHIWNNSVCFWDDEEENDNWEEKCKQAETAYKLTEEQLENVKSRLNGPAYQDCWLRYAVLNEFDQNCELLNHKVSKKGNCYQINIFKDRDFYLYYFKLYQQSKNIELSWGENQKQLCPNVCINTNEIYSYYEKTMELRDLTLKLFQYTHFERAFNMKVSCKIKRSLAAAGKEYLFDIQDQSGRYVFIRYSSQCIGGQVLLTREQFDITELVRGFKNDYQTEKGNIDKLQPEDYLIIYGYPMTSLNSTSGIGLSKYKKEGRTREWCCNKTLDLTLDQPSTTEIPLSMN